MNLAPDLPIATARLVPMADGYAGTMQTIRAMRSLVRQYRTDPYMRQAATSIIFLQPERDGLARPEALFEWVRDNVRYVNDVLGVETLSTPDRTLQALVGDCDDQATLFATLCEAVGYPTRFVVASYNDPQNFEHVYSQVCVDGAWIDADTTERVPLGWAAPLPILQYFERV